MKTLLVSLLFVSSVASADPLKIAAFGDSISQGTNSVVLGSNPQKSWSTGSDINSHLIKLATLRHTNVQSLNASQNGAESSDLQRQIDSLGGFVPDYATILIGANDVCNGFHPGTAENVRRAVRRLVALNPQMEIVLVPIPKLLSLYEAGVERFQCRVRWNLLNICPPFLSNRLNDSQRADNQERVDAINDELSEVAADFPNVRYDRGIGDTDIQAQNIGSIDCFHPSVNGQQLISDLSF